MNKKLKKWVSGQVGTAGQFYMKCCGTLLQLNTIMYVLNFNSMISRNIIIVCEKRL